MTTFLDRAGVDKNQLANIALTCECDDYFSATKIFNSERKGHAQFKKKNLKHKLKHENPT